MKRPIEWHRECLTNAENNLAYEEKRLADQTSEVERPKRPSRKDSTALMQIDSG